MGTIVTKIACLDNTSKLVLTNDHELDRNQILIEYADSDISYENTDEFLDSSLIEVEFKKSQVDKNLYKYKDNTWNQVEFPIVSYMES